MTRAVPVKVNVNVSVSVECGRWRKPIPVLVRIGGVKFRGWLKKGGYFMGALEIQTTESDVPVEVIGYDEAGNELGAVPLKVSFQTIDESLITFKEGDAPGQYLANPVGPGGTTTVVIASVDDPSITGEVEVDLIAPPPSPKIAKIGLRRVAA